MAEIFTPFLAAFILAYALRPVASRLEGLHIPRALAATLTIIFGLSLVTGLFMLLINLLGHEIPLIKTKLPIWVQNTQAWLEPTLAEHHIQFDWAALRETVTQKVTSHLSTNADALVSSTLDTILLSGSSVVHGFVNLILILFVLFYLLIDWDHFFKLIEGFIPPRFAHTARHLCMHTDGLLSQYLRGQILVILVMATFYSIGLSLVGMDGAIALGVFTGLMIIIPYIGITLGLSIGILSAILQFGFGSELLWVLAIFGVGQFLEGFFLTPRLVGERIGLHPVAVLFALIIFGKLFGFFGVLLALPASAVSLVLIQFGWSLYIKSSWYQGK
jgi:predicted PurR-regulated permease PerM